MPIYEYQCQACGDVQELMQKVSDPAPEECGKCHEGPLVKLLSRTAFILKGEGWYVTDFRDKKKPKPADKADAAPDGKADAAKPAEAPAPSSSGSAKEPAAAAAPASGSGTPDKS